MQFLSLKRSTRKCLRPGFIHGDFKVCLSKHACYRAEERLKTDLNIGYSKSEDYYILCLDFLKMIISDDLVQKYINNINKECDVLFKDTRTKMCFVLNINPDVKEIFCLTFGTEINSKWENYSGVRICWIHETAFVYSTAYSGNVTWIR